MDSLDEMCAYEHCDQHITPSDVASGMLYCSEQCQILDIHERGHIEEPQLEEEQ